MTFILSVATSNYVFQVADRRLTAIKPDGSSSVLNDDATKAVFVGGRLSIGYTGLAFLDGVRTDYWIVKALTKVDTRNLRKVVEELAVRATETFKNVRVAPELKRHAFMAVGWDRAREGHRLSPVLFIITNAIDKRGEWEPVAREAFWVHFGAWGYCDQHFCLASVGQTLTRAERKVVWRHLHRIAKSGERPNALMQGASQCVSYVGRKYRGVGAGQSLMCIPRAAVEKTIQTGEILLLEPPIRGAFSVFGHIPADRSQIVTYGPHMVTGGSAVTDYSIRPLTAEEIADLKSDDP